MTRQRGWYSLALGSLLVGFLGMGEIRAANPLAIVDYADEWTKVAGIGPGLDKLKIPYDNLTDEVAKGNLKLGGQAILFISSMATNNPLIHQGLDKNADVIRQFVRDGGAVIEPTQADQNEANVDWLPPELTCVRSDPDHPDFKILKPDHAMFTAPHKLTDANFKGWGYQNWPTVWESIATIKGFDILATTALDKAAIAEAAYGKGKFVMLCIAPDKYQAIGKDANTKEQAALYFENLINAYLPKAVSPQGKTAVSWGAFKKR